MADFLLELLSEEIPARMQAKAQADLARLFAEQLAEAGLAAEAVETYATPRRLALIARGLPAATEAVSEELKGPRAAAPAQALEGFLRKTGLAAEQLVERDGILFATVEKPGRATASVLAEAIPAIVRGFPWPKSMRWGEASGSTESLRWVRPLQGIVALLGEEIVEFEIAGVKSGAATVGHRFHHPGIITIGGAHDYAEKLRACHVILDEEERKNVIAAGIFKVAHDAGLGAVQESGLVAENAGLTECPVAMLGRFDPSFLDVPPEVIRLTMRTNQRYFACTDGNGTLVPNFVCIANIEASDGGAAIVAGNERVLTARLADAKFFWERDLKVPLAEQGKKLGQIIFHEKLGTVGDKVERVAKLARWLVEEGIVGPPRYSPESGNPDEGSNRTAFDANNLDLDAVEREARETADLDSRFRGNDGERAELADLAETAARLCKADLVTGLVGEFPELQGLIGGHLSRAQGQPDAVADAIRDHYKPVGQGDEVPTAPVTVAVSLADKLDTLVSFFVADEKPTGSKDPFALRRAALSVVSLLITNGIRTRLKNAFAVTVVEQALAKARTYPYVDPNLEILSRRLPVMRYNEGLAFIEKLRPDTSLIFEDRGVDIFPDLVSFFADRLKVQQREAGVRHDLIDAVFAAKQQDGSGEDDLVRLLARVKALQGFVETPEGADLLAGYKRAANILKKEGWTGEEGAKKVLSYTPLFEESELDDALDAAEPKVKAAVEAEEYERAMAALAGLRAPVDAFFDKVIVNDPDPDKRGARLALLERMREAVHRVADFSKIEG